MKLYLEGGYASVVYDAIHGNVKAYLSDFLAKDYGGKDYYLSRSGLTAEGWVPDTPRLFECGTYRNMWDFGKWAEKVTDLALCVPTSRGPQGEVFIDNGSPIIGVGYYCSCCQGWQHGGGIIDTCPDGREHEWEFAVWVGDSYDVQNFMEGPEPMDEERVTLSAYTGQDVSEHPICVVSHDVNNRARRFARHVLAGMLRREYPPKVECGHDLALERLGWFYQPYYLRWVRLALGIVIDTAVDRDDAARKARDICSVFWVDENSYLAKEGDVFNLWTVGESEPESVSPGRAMRLMRERVSEEVVA